MLLLPSKSWTHFLAIPLLFSISATFFSSAFQFREFLAAPWSAYAGATFGLVAAGVIFFTWSLVPATNDDVVQRARTVRVFLIVCIPLLLLWGYVRLRA